jgi:hypothetical protein
MFFFIDSPLFTTDGYISTVSIKLLLSRAIFLTVESCACFHAQARAVALGRLYIFAARKCNYTERAW